LGLALDFGHLLFVQGLSLRGPEFGAVTEQDLNQIALRLDGVALLDDEQGHQAVGSQKDDGEQRHQAALFCRSHIILNYRNPVFVVFVTE
jgi:hypothetical protein